MAETVNIGLSAEEASTRPGSERAGDNQRKMMDPEFEQDKLNGQDHAAVIGVEGRTRPRPLRTPAAIRALQQSCGRPARRSGPIVPPASTTAFSADGLARRRWQWWWESLGSPRG